MSYSDDIVGVANEYIDAITDEDNNGERQGWELLRQIMDDAMATPPVWTPARLKAIKTPGMWLSVKKDGGTTNGAEALHWCGIFATWVLRQAGIDVKWKTGTGIRPIGNESGDLDLFVQWDKQKGFDVNSLEPGDVCLIAKNNHHFIVEAASDPNELQTIDGNSDYQSIRRKTHKRKDIVAYYKIIE